MASKDTGAKKTGGKRLYFESFTESEDESDTTFHPEYASTPVTSQPNSSKQPGRAMPASAEDKWEAERIKLQKENAKLAGDVDELKRLLKEAAEAKDAHAKLVDAERRAAQLEEERAAAIEQQEIAEAGLLRAAQDADAQRQARESAEAKLREAKNELDVTIASQTAKREKDANERLVEKYNTWPTFDGTGDVEVFLDQITTICEAKGLDDKRKRFILRAQLRGDAASAPELRVENDENITFAGMKEVLRSRYSQFKSFATVTNDLRKLIRKPKQSIIEFARLVEQTADKAKMTPAQRQLKCRDAFVTGINHQAMQHYIEHNDPDKVSLNEARRLAIAYEHEFGTDAATDVGTSRLETPVVAAVSSTPAEKSGGNQAAQSEYVTRKEYDKTLTKWDDFMTVYYKDRADRLAAIKRRWSKNPNSPSNNNNTGNSNKGNGQNSNNNYRNGNGKGNSNGNAKPKQNQGQKQQGGAQGSGQSS